MEARVVTKIRLTKTLSVALALATTAVTVLSACGGGANTSAGGSSSGTGGVVKIAALEPLSGDYAASGEDDLKAEEFAVQQINSEGGIKSLHGAKLQLVSADTGDTPASATIAAQTTLSKPGISAAIGSWYSDITLAELAVAEQDKIPWLADSGANALVESHFQYVFKLSPMSSVSAEGTTLFFQQAAAKQSGPLRVAVLGDNNISNDTEYALLKTLNSEGKIDITVEKEWTPPLTDATPLAAAAVQGKPNYVMLLAGSASDGAALISALKAQGNTAPLVSFQGPLANPSYLDSPGAANMENLVILASLPFPGKGAQTTNEEYAKFSGQPWMDSEAAQAYAGIWVLAEGIEKAASTNPQKIASTLHSIDIKNVPALDGLFPGSDNIKFGANGEREGGSPTFIQWIDGKPQAVYPSAYAVASLNTK
jgi:branched-chain amino acid transport system substrate-binding protein